MSPKTISQLMIAVFCVISLGTLPASSDATAGLFGTRIMDQTGCCRRCPACDHVCKLDAELVDEEKTCFKVETKVICIPRVVFPWQKKNSRGSCDACDGRGCSDCVHNGARTRKICVLKTDKYKCPKCDYTWTAEKNPCGVRCDSRCAAAGCDSVCDGSVVESKVVYHDTPAGSIETATVEAIQDIEQAPGK